MADTITKKLFQYLKKQYGIEDNEHKIIFGPQIKISSDFTITIDKNGDNYVDKFESGIYSSQYDINTLKVFEVSGNPAQKKSGVPCYVEVQTSIKNSDNFLAVIESYSKNGDRYMRWLTNDQQYARTHPHCFSDKIKEVVASSLVGMLALDNNGNNIDSKL